MPISVTCPECAFRFHVDEAFAGRPGRCPECDAVIQVPAAEIDADRLGDFPSASRRRAAEYPTYREPAREAAAADPGPRIAKWTRVAAGYRNLAIAFVLIVIGSLLIGGFSLASDQKNDDPVKFTSADKALIIGNHVFTAVFAVLWAVGRMGVGKTPYLPARGIGMTAGIMAGLSAVLGVLGAGMAITGVAVAGDDVMKAIVIIQIGGCGLGLFYMGFAVAEIVGLVAQIRIASALGATGASAWAKAQLTAFIALMLAGVVGFCVLFMVLFADMQKQMQAQQAQQQPNNPPPFGKNAPKDAPKNAPANNANNVNNANNPPPPPQFNPADYEKEIKIISLVVMATTVAFSLLCVFSFLASQKAVKREIARLGGGPDAGHDEWGARHAH